MTNYEGKKNYKKMSQLTEDDKDAVWYYFKTERNNTIPEISKFFKIKYHVVSIILDEKFKEVNEVCKSLKEQAARRQKHKEIAQMIAQRKIDLSNGKEVEIYSPRLEDEQKLEDTKNSEDDNKRQ